MEKIRIGIFGLRRGLSFSEALRLNGFEVAAVCDRDVRHVERIRGSLPAGAAVYTDFDRFCEHPMDAVLLANYFHEHAPFAVRLLERGVHVLSECTAAGTMAEAVELVRAAQKSSAVYMLAENYPFMLFNQELRRVYRSGVLGKLLFAEGEYNHPIDFFDMEFNRNNRYFPEHWRNYNPRTYYITHSLAPLAYATGVLPRRVTAFGVHCPPDAGAPSGSYVGDRAAIMLTQNDDGSVYRITGCSAFGAHDNSYRLCGVNGQIENLRGMSDQVMLRFNSWSVPEGREETQLYTPELHGLSAQELANFGHGGGDYFVVRKFREVLDAGEQPEMDVFFATRLSATAILAHRSMLEGGRPFDVPDFRNEADRVRWENDRLTPYYSSDGTPPSLPCSSHTDYRPGQKELEAYLAELNRLD